MTTPFHRHGTRRASVSGFSLIETVLALGIMSLAITALLGLLPHGIEMSRKAANASAQSRIIDQIQGRLSNNSFTGLAAMGDQILHFDDQGELLDQDLRDAVYIARVVVAGTAGMMLPGGSAAEETLLKFQIQIAATPKLDFDFVSAKPNAYQSVPLLIAPMIP